MEYIFVNANFYEQDNIEAVLIKDGIIFETGSLESIKLSASKPVYIDLKNKLLLPAMTDAHTHFIETSKHLLTINLSDCKSPEEFLETLKNYRNNLTENLQWISGYGWEKQHIEKFPEINKFLIDKVFPDIPVNLASRDLHSNLCNSKALEIININNNPNSYPGVIIDKLSNGETSGFLYEQSWTLLSKYMPVLDIDIQKKLVKKLINKSWEYGLCGVHSFEDKDSANIAQEICKDLPFYFKWYYLDETDKSNFLNNTKRFSNGGLKYFSDGSMGSDTAWMFKNGLSSENKLDLKNLKDKLCFADANGIQTAVHAIGDLAVYEIAKIFKDIYHNSNNKIKHRIEHLQAVRPQDINLLKEANIHASMQAIHLKEDIDLIEKKWLTEKKYAFPIKSMLENGIQLALGSDSPVETLNPFEGIFYAVTRSKKGCLSNSSFLKSESISLNHAINAYTVGHHLVSNNQINYGKIEKGMKANLIVTEDFVNSEISKLLEMKSQLTMIDGHIVFSQINI